MTPLRQSLGRGCRWLWQRRGGIRDLLGLFNPNKERDLADGRTAARARFWDAVREGRCEAEAQCAKPDRQSHTTKGGVR